MKLEQKKKENGENEVVHTLRNYREWKEKKKGGEEKN